MLIYEIYKKDIRDYGSIQEAIKQGYYIPRDNKFIKNAFAAGHGTKKDMNRYMKDNSIYCVWVMPDTLKEVKHI